MNAAVAPSSGDHGRHLTARWAVREPPLLLGDFDLLRLRFLALRDADGRERTVFFDISSFFGR